MVKKKLVWDEEQRNEFKKQIKHIKKDSIQNAELVRKSIIEKVNEIPIQEERYPRDKYKQNNDGSYRAFELHHIRIAYYIGKEEIRIIRVRSTHQEPKNY
ncbi:MAG: type II toxin-antitoxin system RelE/ParE family toxin [Chitinophagales bacterium]|nr:type II toxin-antitoxin system RelE/ParE family toxin [Chitinophagales bacterium]